jgi:hypothetical protein
MKPLERDALPGAVDPAHQQSVITVAHDHSESVGPVEHAHAGTHQPNA